MEGRKQRLENLKEKALGLVTTSSFPAIVGAADAMLKSADVTLVGYEKIGSGHCTAIVRGKISDVRLAVEMGADAVEKSEQLISTSVISRPLANLEAVLPIGSRLAQLAHGDGYSRLGSQAIGLLETRGFPAMVAAADIMLKSAEVQLSAYETTGAGLCTVIIRGSVADVVVALEAGMYEARRVGELNAVMVIPRPLDDLEQTLPIASCWIEQPKPLQIPLSIKETAEVEAEERVALPDLKRLPAQIGE